MFWFIIPLFMGKKIINKKDILGKGLFIAEIVLTAALILVAFFSFHYTDFSDSLDNGVMLLESIKAGQFREFYRYAAMNSNDMTVYTANYNVILYFVFLIWNLPTAILHVTGGFDYMGSAKALLWCKSLILLMILASAYVLYKILSEYVEDKKLRYNACLMFAASSSVIVPSMVACQYDIFSIFFILLGIYYYIKKDHRKSFIFFVVAIPFKSFAFFIFFPLLLLREKNILNIAWKTVLVFSLQILSSLPFYGEPYYDICLKSQNGDAMELLMESRLSLGGAKINLFVLSFIALLVFCYIKKLSFEEEKDARVPVFVSSLAIATFILFTNIRSYWVIMAVPFMLLLCFSRRTSLRVNLLIFIMGTSAFSFFTIYDHWIFSKSVNIDKMLLGRLSFIDIPSAEERTYESISAFYKLHGLNIYSSAFYTVFFVAFVLLLVLNCPFKGKSENGLSLDIFMIPLEIFLSAIPVVLLLYVNLASSGSPVYSAPAEDLISRNIINDNLTVSQEFVCGSDDIVEMIEIVPGVYNNDRMIRDTVRFALTDVETGEVLADETVGVALLKDDETNRITFAPVTLLKGHTYRLDIEGINSPTPQISTVELPVTSSLTDPDHPATVDGQAQEYNLAFLIR